MTARAQHRMLSDCKKNRTMSTKEKNNLTKYEACKKHSYPELFYEEAHLYVSGFHIYALDRQSSFLKNPVKTEYFWGARNKP